MCNDNCLDWAKRNLTRREVRGRKTIEIGAYNVNGSLRRIIEAMEPGEYLGIDIRHGPGVDLICRAEEVVGRFGRNHFDLVICTCVLEHIREWRTAVSALKQVCKPGGLILIIVPFCWSFHAYPSDYWRYAPNDLEEIFADCEILNLDQDPTPQSLIYAKIRKPASFVERNLSDFCLHSIIADKRIEKCQWWHFFTPRFVGLTWVYHYKRVRSRMFEKLMHLTASAS
jgi:SAM-dependent methyltransferase